LWKGESFDQYDPHGRAARICPWNSDVERRATRRTAGGESILAAQIPAEERLAAHKAESQRARVGFRRVTNRTNSRSVIAALIPPKVLLVNSVRYLVFPGGTDRDRACCLGLLNSLPFDWQARRFVETDLGYYVLEGLRIPSLDQETYDAIATAAARLSCPDERFAEFAEATGVEVSTLSPDERNALRAEIDARVAHAWGLEAADLETIFADFTLDAVPDPYRQRVRDRFAELTAR
jgi:hypothetical protein